MILRSSVTSRSAESPSRRTVIVTFVPSGPRSRSAASSIVRPAVDFPSTFTIWSPERSPARNAGLPSIGEITVG